MGRQIGDLVRSPLAPLCAQTEAVYLGRKEVVENEDYRLWTAFQVEFLKQRERKKKVFVLIFSFFMRIRTRRLIWKAESAYTNTRAYKNHKAFCSVGRKKKRATHQSELLEKCKAKIQPLVFHGENSFGGFYTRCPFDCECHLTFVLRYIYVSLYFWRIAVFTRCWKFRLQDFTVRCLVYYLYTYIWKQKIDFYEF